MAIKRILCIVVLQAFVILTTCSCIGDNGDKRYVSFVKEFYTLYFDLIDHIFTPIDTEVLELLTKEENQKRVSNIINLMQRKNEVKIPDDRKFAFDYLLKNYNQLLELNEIAKKDWDEVPKDQRIKTSQYIIRAFTDFIEWEDKESKRVWW